MEDNKLMLNATVEDRIEHLKESIVSQLPRRKGYIISIGNSKGGVGKTTSTNLIAYNLARLGVKTLVIDADKQANATKTLLLTKKLEESAPDISYIDKSFMEGLEDGSFSDAIIQIMPNLDLIPGDSDTRRFTEYIYSHITSKMDRDFIVHDAIRKIRFDYDIVLIDSPPNNYELMRSITLTSDYVIVSFQPQEHSMTGAENFIEDLNQLKEEYDFDLYVLGFLPSLVKRGGRVDDVTLLAAEESFHKDNIFNTRIYLRERIKLFDVSGITSDKTNPKAWDNEIHDIFFDVIHEFIDRLIKYEKALGGIVDE